MNEPSIKCPKCQAEIKLTEVMAAPLIDSARKQFEQQLAAKDAEMKSREETLQSKAQALDVAQKNIDESVKTKLEAERTKIVMEETEKAKRLAASDLALKTSELTEMKALLEQQATKLTEAQKAQVELIRKQRELDDAKREMELTIEQQVQASLSTAREKARKEAEDSIGLRLAERDQQIASMTAKIEDLKKRAEQGSQQLQGEVQELQLESLLRAKFPLDSIEPVPKGEFGGDAVHRVSGPNGPVGTILWESKRTKNWVDGWLPKLRDDQRAAKAEVAIIVTQTLPKGVETFDLIDGVWVTCPSAAIAVAVSLRQALIEIAQAKNSGEGQKTKTELLYAYLTGPAFRHRVTAILEKLNEMREGLDKERKSMQKFWAAREQQINCFLDSTAGMYGDIQGIAGSAVKEIEALGVLALPGPDTAAA